MKIKRKEIYIPCLLAPLLMLLLLQELSPHYRVAAAAAGADNRQCDGSIEECGDIDEELVMESESNGRILQATRISYGAIGHDCPACGGPEGQPYSISCLPPSSNRYNRGCSKIYRCRY
ncbi:protein RALF-like 32 [Durio zibethinus]|uniref:Protein RALF-like 32 n=1 Tax=Durio zibethinus TaxID=66656 RepID=A0A6P5XZ46_DURZI|nr:protein RALF-like 32 [Durio zibethinus]